MTDKTREDVETLQVAWDEIESLPPLIFSDFEARELITAIRSLPLSNKGESRG